MSILAFIAGVIACCFIPDKYQGWVRGAWAALWGRGRTRAPAPSSPTAELLAAANEATRPAPRGPTLLEMGANLLRFFGGCLAWCARNPIAAIAVVLLVLFVIFGRSCSPFDWGKSKGELRLEREIARMDATIAQHEARLADVSRDLAVNTERDRARRSDTITNTEREIDDAAAQVDADALYDAYARGYLCVLDAGACTDRPDPAPGRPATVRGARADVA